MKIGTGTPVVQKNLIFYLYWVKSGNTKYKAIFNYITNL